MNILLKMTTIFHLLFFQMKAKINPMTITQTVIKQNKEN